MCKQRKPIKYAERCKVCNGKGWVVVYRHGSDIGERRTCHTCRGSGKNA